jgi:hypothetical protein
MKAYRILPGNDIDGLRLEDIPGRPLAPQEVRLKVHQLSNNCHVAKRGSDGCGRAPAALEAAYGR